MQNRNIYLSIAAVFIVLSGIIFYLEGQRLSPENLDATIDARVALALEGQNDEEILSTVEAQRPLLLTDVALAYPSETARPTDTPTLAPTATSLLPPTATIPQTAIPQELRAYQGIEILADINSSGIFALDNANDYFAVSEANILRVYNIHVYHLLWEQETVSPITHLVWSPNDDRILSAHEDGHVFLWRFEVSEPLLSLELGQGLSDLLWSPDGTAFLTAIDNELKVWDLEGIETTTIPVGLQPQVAWGRVGRSLLVSDSQGFFTLDLATGNLQALVNIALPVTLFDAAPDGFRVAYVDADNIIHNRTLSLRQSTGQARPAYQILSIDWSPNEEYLVTSDAGNNIQIRNADSGSTLLSLQHNASLLDARWTADSERVFIVTDFIYVIEFSRD